MCGTRVLAHLCDEYGGGMSGTRPIAQWCLVGCLAVATPWACEQRSRKPSDTPVAAASSNVPAKHPRLDGWSDLWRAGAQSEAVTAFENTPWEDASATFSAASLLLSESEFVRRSPQQRDQLRDEAVELAGVIRGLVKAAMRESVQRAANGDAEGGQRLRTAVQRLADRLSDKERRLQIYNLVGDAIQDMLARPHEAAAAAPAQPG